MGADRIEPADEPWPRQLLNSPWLLAGAALLFFTLSYVVSWLSLSLPTNEEVTLPVRSLSYENPSARPPSHGGLLTQQDSS